MNPSGDNVDAIFNTISREINGHEPDRPNTMLIVNNDVPRASAVASVPNIELNTKTIPQIISIVTTRFPFRYSKAKSCGSP